ncbi:CDP-glycerol glycerophosphotransferase family protein [Blastococcus goldschmidtiae]|uniref:CDP-glycerol glycerophosphotransferase family protein n=1 Tax=Blastococcus goldschmidtiae TaxID=3075546 RepID=A0ABU2KD95_9ACTN|nr:CDP-glycerol glycerophosphotransferase family protein [Blastococcus sp. DSM 46792]MDT0278169.1 CDP-glycerol glycerophosphotransferase family protein [Blastococcus sp. DSM 46792]
MNIVYVAFRGHFSDSPRALYDELLDRGVEATNTWLSAPHTQATFPDDVTTVPFGSPESIAALEGADLVISNDHIPLDWEKPPGAVYLQTWHGTMLKRVHNDVLWAPEGRLAYLDQDIARWDLLLSPNAITTERLRKAFGFTGPIHETGLPRNDLLLGPRRDEVRARVRAELGIADGQTAVLYTPTWRDDLVFAGGEGGAGRSFEFPIDLEAFTERLGGDHVLLLRLHNMVLDRLEPAEGSVVRDVSGYPDIQDLYVAADVMVTDYSSTMFDFANTGRPMVFFTYDLDRYRDQLRGFYFDLEEVAPGPLVRTSPELVDAIAGIEAISDQYAARYARFRETFTHLEDGAATRRVLDLILPTATASGQTRTTEGDDDRALR